MFSTYHEHSWKFYLESFILESQNWNFNVWSWKIHIVNESLKLETSNFFQLSKQFSNLNQMFPTNDFQLSFTCDQSCPIWTETFELTIFPTNFSLLLVNYRWTKRDFFYFRNRFKITKTGFKIKLIWSKSGREVFLRCEPKSQRSKMTISSLNNDKNESRVLLLAKVWPKMAFY